MTLQHSIQKGISDFSFIIGTGLKYGGAGGLLVMAVVGTVAIDLVLLAAAEKHHNSFLTGFVLGSMFSRGNLDPVPLLIASPITSAVAVVLSVALGVPGVGLAILAGWTLAGTLLAVGMGLEALAKSIDPEPSSESDYNSCLCFN
ncbi:TPA: hypothetical protein RGN17_001117 [Legionella pneumophila]|nr:hypothetical protein [Legionella pneumophila]HAU1575987.1 hypothetical protein [Legionella pneumophila]HAU1680384.1 hypothetical protein [Legionella pneumophila]HAU3700067.1 hypothetical protein [Legionella pneumophila]HDU8294432.1 hypothetical protein [Legionella pneumophila]